MDRSTDGAVNAACLALANLCSNGRFRLPSTETCGAAPNLAVLSELDEPRAAVIADYLSEHGSVHAVFARLHSLVDSGRQDCCCGPTRLFNVLAASDKQRMVLFEEGKQSVEALLAFATHHVGGCPTSRLHALGAFYHAFKHALVRGELLR